MLQLHDHQVRLVLLNHVTVRLSDGQAEELDAAGIDVDELNRLRRLSALDLNRLAAMRSLTIGIAFDSTELKAGLRAVALANEMKSLETYFIRNGASTKLMSTLFKMRRKLTLKRRREIGTRRPAGRVRLPDYPLRELIYRAWMGISDPVPRVCYYRLHQAFPSLPIAVLETVIRTFEAEL